MSNQPLAAPRLRLMASIAGGLLVLLAVSPIIPALRLLAQERKEVKISSPLVLVPESTAFFVHVRIGDLTKSEVFKLILPAAEQPRLLQELCFGIPVEQVDTITIASNHSPFMNMIDPAAQSDFVPRRHRFKPNFDFKDKERFFKDGFKDLKEDIKDGFKVPFKDKKEESLRRGARTVPVAFQKEIKEFQIKDAAKDFHDFGPPGFRDRPPNDALAIITVKKDLDVEDLILLRPERVFKSKKGKAILDIDGLLFCRLNPRTLVCAEREEVLDRFLDRPIPDSIKGPLAPALERAASGKHTITVGQAIPEKALNESLDESQRQGRFRIMPPGMIRTMIPLMKARPGVLTVDLGTNLAAAAEFHYADEAAAKKAVRPIQDIAVLLRIFGIGVLEEEVMFRGDPLDESALQKVALEKLLLGEVEDALQAAPVERKGTTVRVAVALPMTLDALKDKAKQFAKDQLKDPKFLAGRRRAVSNNNLKQIAIALHAHHDTYRMMPPQAICDANGKPLLSWRVAILPFIEQQPLYQQFRLNEPWDSEHNLKLLKEMPAVYAPPGVKTKEPYTTFYQSFVGPNTGFEFRPAGNNKPFGAIGTRIPQDFPDGTSNVWLVAEAAEPVPWTKPADMKYDPKGPLPKLGGLFAPGFHAAFADGHVHYYPRPLADDVMRIVITRNNGIPRPPEVHD